MLLWFQQNLGATEFRSKNKKIKLRSRQLSWVPEQSSRVFTGLEKYPARRKVEFIVSSCLIKIYQSYEEAGKYTY